MRCFEADVRYLLRHMDIRSYDRALAVIEKYFALERFPQKTLYALQELLPPEPGDAPTGV
jgi:hypothetical protein